MKRLKLNTLNHLGLVPCLSLRSAAVGNVFILGLHFCHDGVHVKVAAVVHLHHHGRILDLALQLLDFLERNQSQVCFRTTLGEMHERVKVK